MASEWAQNKIKKWTEKGMLSKEFILECIDKRIQEGYGISEKEESALARVFQSVCKSEGLLTEATFISLLETKATLRHSPEVIEAGKVLYASLAYLSTLPFPSKPQVATLPAGLSLAELTRSLVWAFPDRYTYLIEESLQTRLRTKADHRRLLFQSLASSTSDKPYNPESARRLAQFNAFDVDRGWYDPEMCISNHDDGGDEIYYDLLDLLYSRQEIKHVWLAGVPRDALRPVAKRLATESETPSLYALGIPTERFISIVKFLLALQFEPPETGVDLTGYDAAARSVCAAFCEEKEAVITWPMFDRGVREVTPYLFDPFYYMMSITYLGKPGFYGLCEALDPDRAFGGILTLPLYCQLATFLAFCVYFGELRRIHHYASPARLSPTEFVNAMETVPNKAIMVLSGTTSAGEACIFGVFSPKPTLDGTSVQSNSQTNRVGQEPCSIFQLAPVQGVFRGAIGKRGWTVDDDAVRFGQDGGVVLTLKDGLSRGDIIHQVSEEDWDIIHQVPKEDRNIIHQVPEEDEDSIHQVPEEDEDSIHQVPEEDEDSIHQVPEEDEDSIHQVPEEDEDIIHQVPEEDGSPRVYKPNGWRGNWEVSFEISQIEIWSEEKAES